MKTPWQWFVDSCQRISLLVGLVLLAWLIWQWLLVQPGPIQTGLLTIVAAVIAFAGAWYGVREHARRESKAREIDMRRQVYFQMAEEFARMRAFLSRAPAPQAAEADLEDMIKEFGTTAAKFHIVGDFRGIECLTRYQIELHSIISALSSERAELMRLKAEYDQLTEWRNELIQRIKTSPPNPLPGETDAQYDARIMAPANEVGAREIRAAGALALQSLAMFNKSNTLIEPLGPIEDEAVLLARGIFGFPIDAEKYRQVKQLARRKIGSAVKGNIETAVARVRGTGSP